MLMRKVNLFSQRCFSIKSEHNMKHKIRKRWKKPHIILLNEKALKNGFISPYYCEIKEVLA